MSPIGLVDSFQRFEEFSSFISCIKCFGRPIIPPLLTPNQRPELQRLREAAVNKEAEIRRRKEDYLNNLDSHTSSSVHSTSDLEPQETCALWCPSSKDRQEGVSIAISKFPTSSIYSSVHTGAIVCSDLIENTRRYASRSEKDPAYYSENASTECLQCSHSDNNLDCHLCQSEYDQSLHNCSFGSEESSEVPCRTHSLLQSSPSFVGDDHNSTMDETECESLLTVIYSQKPDTDTESSITCMTQSTDLDKYMGASCEFGSPDNSSAIWDSKSISLQYNMSRSDDASTETMVNTENELTPCASTLAEFTDNIEDEYSNAEETVTDVKPGKLKRAHSIDSYMKIIQSCARSMHFKKSSSEPLSTTSKISSNSTDDIKSFGSVKTVKTSYLIKEDSKESEESKDLPEKDVCVNGTNETTLSYSDDVPVSISDDINSFQKKHVRKNSYTLDHPSPVLIQAHADCICSFDSNSLSPPHCSALEDKNIMSNSAFTKEKVEINIPVSVQEKYPILNCNVSTENTTQDLTSSVMDVFPVVNEDSCKKSNSENSNMVEKEIESGNVNNNETETELNSNLNLDEYEESNKRLSSTSVCDSDPSQDYFKHIYKELQERYEVRVRELLEEQNRQWLKFREEFKEQEMLLYENLKLSVPPDTDPVSKAENPISNEKDSVPEKEITFNNSLTHNDHKATATNPTYPPPEQSHHDDNITQNQNFEVPYQNSSPYRCPSLSYNQTKNPRASLTPSNECETPFNGPSILKTSSGTQIDKNFCASFGFTYESNDDQCMCTSNSLHDTDQFPSQSAVLLPQYESQTFSEPVSSDMNLESPCLCDKSPPKCHCYESLNGYHEKDVYLSNPDYADRNFMPHQFNPHTSTSSNTVNKDYNSVDSSACDEAGYLRRVKTAEAPSKQVKDSHISRKIKSVSSPDILHLPNTTKDKSVKTIPQQSLKDKSKFPMNNIISLYVKSLKNGSVSSFDATNHKKIVIDPSVLERFVKLPAFVKGYLTRRLFKTERVQGLIKTLQDTALLIRKLSEDLSRKGDDVSERDVDFHRQLIVQLMTTFHNVYDIFCTVSTKERMDIISESRNLKLKQKALEQKQEPVIPVTIHAPVPDPSKKQKLSSATLKALERKKRSTIDSRTYTLEDFKSFRTRSALESRTYTIEDLKGHIGRPRSQTLSKSHSASPSSIYKASIGVSPKRKTASSKTSITRRCVQLNWVP